MRYYRKSWVPPFERVLLVESGSRSLIENLLSGIYANCGPQTPIDIVTCYAGVPRGLNTECGRVYWINEYGPAERHRLLSELIARKYTIIGIVCSAEPIMTKWKWWLTWKIPAKALIVNENGDYFYVHLANWRVILHFVMFRAGLTGTQAVHTLARLVLFPFTLAYLAGFAGWIHFKRRVRLALGK